MLSKNRKSPVGFVLRSVLYVDAHFNVMPVPAAVICSHNDVSPSCSGKPDLC